MMAVMAKRTNPKLWEKVKKQVTAGNKGGVQGDWSARKAQLAVGEYKRQGGGYEGGKDPHNHVAEWTKAEWGTKSGRKSGDTHERCLPKKAREALSDEEYERTTARKRADTKKGRQFSAQPDDVAKKTAPYRGAMTEPTKHHLMAEARKKDIPGRSRMNNAELAKALSR